MPILCKDFRAWIIFEFSINKLAFIK